VFTKVRVKGKLIFLMEKVAKVIPIYCAIIIKDHYNIKRIFFCEKL
jgi:hypothetical protein